MTILGEVKRERKRQDMKWGTQTHLPIKWLLILGKQYGDCCRCESEGSGRDYRRELVQVAAVAVAAMESFDRGDAQ